MKTRITVLTALLAVLVTVLAEQAYAGPRVAQAGADLQARRQQVMQRIREVRARKLTRALDLDQATRDKLLPILDRYDRELARLARENHALRKQVRALVESGATDAAAGAELDRLIDRMTALQRELWKQQEARFAEVRKVLTPPQAAAIFVVLPKLDRKIHRQIRRAMRGQQGPGERGKRR